MTKSASNPNVSEIDVQGDVSDGIAELLATLYKVPANLIVFK